jgi:hypothetical protein
VLISNSSEILADHQHGAAAVGQRDQLAANAGDCADVEPPRRLSDDQQARRCVDLAPHDELLEVAAREAPGQRRWTLGLDVEPLDQPRRHAPGHATAQPAGACHRLAPREQRVVRQRQARNRAVPDPPRA